MRAASSSPSASLLYAALLRPLARGEGGTGVAAAAAAAAATARGRAVATSATAGGEGAGGGVSSAPQAWGRDAPAGAAAPLPLPLRAHGSCATAAGAASTRLRSMLPLGLSGVAAYSSHAQAAMQVANALSIPAKSLRCERAPIKLPEPLDNQMGRFLLTLLGFYSHKSQLLHGGQQLYDAIKEQCDDGAMIKAFGMDETVFFSTYTLLALHVWLVIHRLGSGAGGPDVREFRQRFYVHFSNDVERRVHRAGVQVGVGKWLKQLETVFYSSGIALDKVLSGESDETFTEVVLTHFFGADATKKAQAALIAKYLQRELHCLQLTEEPAIMRGHIRFSQEPFEQFRAAKVAPRQA